MLSDADTGQGLSLGRTSHAVAKPLWQQRTFTQTSGEALLAHVVEAAQHNEQGCPANSSGHPLCIQVAETVQQSGGVHAEMPDSFEFICPADLLLSALHEGLRSATPAPLPVLEALAHAAAAVPPQLLRFAVPHLMPWLLEALRRLQVCLWPFLPAAVPRQSLLRCERSVHTCCLGRRKQCATGRAASSCKGPHPSIYLMLNAEWRSTGTRL